MFMLIGSAEKAGSGADKIMQGWKKANYRNPRIEEITHPDKVVLTLPLVSLLSDEVISYLKSLFGEDITSIEHNKLMTLATCCSEGEVTNYRMQLVLDKHSADITKLLKELCNDRYLIPEGIGRGTHYRINKKFRERELPGNVASNVASSPDKERRRRLSSSELHTAILQACVDFESLEAIANKVGKSLRYLKNRAIPIMVAEGLLEREYPYMPKHPHQRYRAKKR